MILEAIESYIESPSGDGEIHFKNFKELAEYSFKRQFTEREKSDNAFRLSNSGHCARKLAYKQLKFPLNGKEMDARSHFVFWYGDILEACVLTLAQLAGLNICYTGREQKTVTLDCGNGLKIDGHPDGFWGDYLVEIKSMTSYGFREFQERKISEEYLCQANANMEASGLDKMIMIAINKESGVLCEQVLTKNSEYVEMAKATFRELKGATTDKLPERKYKPTNGLWPWQCGYCAYWKTCLEGKAEQIVIKGKYKLKELKEVTPCLS